MGNFAQNISNKRVLYLKSKKPNKILKKRILTDTMLRIIEQTRKGNLYYGKRKIQEMLLRQGYDLKLTTIGNGLKILMKRGRIQPVYVLSSTKERQRIRKFNKCYAKMYLLSKRHKFILPYGFKYKRKRN